MDESSVKTMVSVTQTLITPEDAAIGERLRRLINKALDEVETILEFGCHADRMAIVKLLVQPAGRMVGAGTTSQTEEVRVAFEELLAEARTPVLPPKETIVTESRILDVAPSALPPSPYDQGQGNQPS